MASNAPFDADSSVAPGQHYQDNAQGYARDAWLNRRVLSHVDVEVGGAYVWDPAEYAPVPVTEDGDAGLVFAKT